MVRIYNKTAVG